MRGHRLPSPPFFLEFTYVFRLSVSTRKVASEYPFCVLIYMNSYIFHIYFILFIFLSNTYLIFNIRRYAHTHPHTHTKKGKKKGGKKRKKKKKRKKGKTKQKKKKKRGDGFRGIEERGTEEGRTSY